MRFRRTVLPLLALTTLVWADTTAVSLGKTQFEKKCRICHASDGSGSPTMRQRFGDRLPTLTSNDIQAKNQASLVEALKTSNSHQALIGKMSANDLKGVVAYILTLKPKP